MTSITRFVYSLLLIGVFCIYCSIYQACQKEENLSTTIVGKISDKKTKAPIQGAYVSFEGIKGEIPNQYFQDFNIYSDSTGAFRIIIPNEYTRYFHSIFKTGYLPKISLEGVQSSYFNDSIYHDVLLIPTDGFLRLTLHNKSGTSDPLYLKFSSPTTLIEKIGLQQLKPFPMEIISGASYTGFFAFPSGEDLGIYWDTQPFQNTSAPYNKSIFLTPNDTVEVVIEF